MEGEGIRGAIHGEAGRDLVIKGKPVRVATVAWFAQAVLQVGDGAGHHRQLGLFRALHSQRISSHSREQAVQLQGKGLRRKRQLR